jgi:uncharacterized protein YceK
MPIVCALASISSFKLSISFLFFSDMAIHRLILIVLTIAGCMQFTGCASIISGRNADVMLSSNAPNTHVFVHDKHGQQVASVDAPAVVSLKRKDRFIWPARYTATFESPGYAPVVEPIKPTVNPWVVGNVVAGGLIGLAVDNVTGAAWKPQDDHIVAQMAPMEGTSPAPQMATATPAVGYERPLPVLPTPQAASQPTAQPAAYVDSSPLLPASSGLQRTATADNAEPTFGGTSFSVGTSHRF